MSAKVSWFLALLVAASIAAPATGHAHRMTIYNCTSKERMFQYWGGPDPTHTKSIQGNSSARTLKNGKEAWKTGAPYGGACSTWPPAPPM